MTRDTNVIEEDLPLVQSALAELVQRLPPGDARPVQRHDGLGHGAVAAGIDAVARTWRTYVTVVGVKQENERLRRRVAQIYDRLETHLKQVLREGELRERCKFAVNDIAALLLILLEGRIAHFARSDFKSRPTARWDAQWAMLQRSIFADMKT